MTVARGGSFTEEGRHHCCSYYHQRWKMEEAEIHCFCCCCCWRWRSTQPLSLLFTLTVITSSLVAITWPPSPMIWPLPSSPSSLLPIFFSTLVTTVIVTTCTSIVLVPTLPTHFPPLSWLPLLSLYLHIRHHLQVPYYTLLLGQYQHHHLNFTTKLLLLFPVLGMLMDWLLEEEGDFS